MSSSGVSARCRCRSPRIRHRLLPGSYTCEAGQFTLAAWLEPAGEVGGDTFDFALGRDRRVFLDHRRVGQTVNAALLETLMIGAIRNGRRQNADLAAQAARRHGPQRARRPIAVRHRPDRLHRPGRAYAVRRRCVCATAS